MRRLDGRIAVVSGGASGLGLATAKRLATDGAILEIIDKDDASSVCNEIAAMAALAYSTQCDVTEQKQVVESVKSIESRHGKVDILVNNAGILTARKPWHLKSRIEIERFMQVNYIAVYSLTQSFYPLIKKSSHGRIIMVGSRTVFTGTPGMAGYIESKAAVMSLARVLAVELGGEGITVNSVAPGMVATPGTRANSNDEVFDRMMGMQAISRRVEPRHVAACVAFLASDDAEMITGQTILCDGGGFLH